MTLAPRWTRPSPLIRCHEKIHGQGTVHNDFHGSNVMRNRDGRPVASSLSLSRNNHHGMRRRGRIPLRLILFPLQRPNSWSVSNLDMELLLRKREVSSDPCWMSRNSGAGAWQGGQGHGGGVNRCILHQHLGSHPEQPTWNSQAPAQTPTSLLCKTAGTPPA